MLMKRCLDFSASPDPVGRPGFIPSALAPSRPAFTRSRVIARREVRFRAFYVGFIPTPGVIWPGRVGPVLTHNGSRATSSGSSCTPARIGCCTNFAKPVHATGSGTRLRSKRSVARSSRSPCASRSSSPRARRRAFGSSMSRGYDLNGRPYLRPGPMNQAASAAGRTPDVNPQPRSENPLQIPPST